MAVLFGSSSAGWRADDDRDLAGALHAQRANRAAARRARQRPGRTPDDPMLVATAFGVVQEAITNAARQETATAWWVALEATATPRRHV